MACWLNLGAVKAADAVLARTPVRARADGRCMMGGFWSLPRISTWDAGEMRGTLIKARSTDRRSSQPFICFPSHFWDPPCLPFFMRFYNGFSHLVLVQRPLPILRGSESHSADISIAWFHVFQTAKGILCLPTVKPWCRFCPLGNASILCLARRRHRKRSWRRSKRKLTTAMTAWRTADWLLGLPEGYRPRYRDLDDDTLHRSIGSGTASVSIPVVFCSCFACLRTPRTCGWFLMRRIHTNELSDHQTQGN